MKRIQLLLALLPGILSLSASAASTDTWVGGTGNNFSTLGNWTYSPGPGPVASGDSLTFAGAGSTTPNNDETAFTFGGLTFSGTTVYTVGGNDFTLGSGGIIANSGAVTQIINNNIGLTGTGGTINPSIASSAITLGGIISGSANFTKSGNSTSTLTLSGVNTFSGVLNFNAGTVVFTTPPGVSGGNLGNPSGITFGGSSTTTLVTTPGAGSVTISTPTITLNTSSSANFKNGGASGTTLEISAKLTGAGNCKQASPTTSGAIVRLSNDTSDFTGTLNMAAGTLEYTSVANGGSPSALGAGTASYILANSSSAGTFRYVGSGNTTTTRNIDWQATTGGLSLDSSGAGSVQFLGSSNLRSGNGVVTLTLTGTSAGANKLSQVINDGPVSGATTVSKTTAGTWTLAGANTYTGGTSLSAGLLNLGGASALAGGTFTIGGNASFDNTTGGLITLANAFTLSGGSPTYIGSADLTINGAVTLSAANRTITVNAGNLTLGGVIGDAGGGRSLTKAGAGKLTLASSSANTYTGSTTNSAGTLQLSGNATLGAAGTAVTVSGGTLDLGGTSQAPGAVTISGTGTIQNGTLTGTSYLGSLGSGLATVSATLAGASSPVTLSGAGSLMLLGPNTYNGGTAISGSGTLIVTNDAGLGNSSAGVTFGASGTLATTNNAAAGVTNSATVTSARTITVNSTVTASFATLDTNNLTIAAKITGAGNVLKKSSSFSLGTVRFSNDANNYTGDFTAGFGNTEFTSVADQGTASSLGVGATGTGGQITINNATSSGTLRYVGAGSSVTHRPLNWSGTTGTYAIDASGGGPIQFLATASLKSGSGSEELRMRGTNTGPNTLAQVVNDSGGTTWLTKFDAGTWVISGANTFSGAVTNNGGVLQVNAAETPGTSGPLGKAGALWFAGGTLQYSSANSFDYSSRFSTAASQAVKIDCNGQTVTFATPLTSTGGSLAVSSSAAGGSLILSATNTYSGATIVSSGTLLVNGVVGGGAVTVSGGTLAGAGAISNAVAVQAGGRLQPGAGGSDIETLTLGNTLSLSGTNVMLLNRTNAQNASLITGISTLTNGGTLIVTNVGDPLQGGDTFTLFGASGYVGTFSATNLPALTGGLVWDLSKLAVNGAISVDQPPVAANLTASVVENQTLAIATAKLLTLCSDPDNDTLTIVSVGPTSTNGGAAALSGPNVTYTPVANFTGTDLFTYVVSDGRGGTATGNVLVSVTSSNAPSLNIVSGPSMLPDGHFHVGFAGIPGYSYTVQYSPNFDGPWTTLTNLTAASDGLFDFEDPTDPAPPSRFYRTTYP